MKQTIELRYPDALPGHKFVSAAKRCLRLLDLILRLIYDPLTDCNSPIQTSWVSK